MKITSTTLHDLRDRDKFIAIYGDYVREYFAQAVLYPQLAKARIIEAHVAWLGDLKRVGDHEPNLEDGLDHLKQAGHLAFWLRRMSPIVESIDMAINLADATQNIDLTPHQEEFRNLLTCYANEYFAFDFCFQISKFYEIGKEGGSERASSLVLTKDYYTTICHFLKYKTVSPHGLFLIYKSLFS